MVGIEKFKEFFADYTDQYVLIGGAACDILFSNNFVDFRVTKDLDIVLIVEALTRDFAEKFWEFIRTGNYINRAKSNGNPQFYRFEKPQSEGYPSMLELFSRTEWNLNTDSVLTPIHIDDSISSLSAILLDESYYEALLEGRDVINGISILKPEWIIPFKVKAWLDLQNKKEQNIPIDSKNIRKHRNDVLRIVSELALSPVKLPNKVKEDMKIFIEQFSVTDTELKNLKLSNIHSSEIIQLLKNIYGI
ncbi:MAG: hypothetical protein IIT39_14300 [Clostridia bacterium]|nr:hypothetical protein [Clostridia bacterium]